MIKANISLVGGICGTLLFAIIASAQAPLPASTSLQAHVTLSSAEADLSIKTRSYKVPFKIDSTGKFKAGDFQPAIFPAECDPANSRPANATAQQVGTEVTGTVNVTPDGRYRVQVTVTSRSVAGCRTVGNLNIPVFSNIVLSTDAVIVIGEILPIMIADSSSIAPLKVEVALLPDFERQ